MIPLQVGHRVVLQDDLGLYALPAKVLVRELRAEALEASHQFLQQGLHQDHPERRRDIGLLQR